MMIETSDDKLALSFKSETADYEDTKTSYYHLGDACELRLY